MMLEQNLDVPLGDVNTHVLAGYSEYRQLTDVETKLLPSVVRARLAQSLTLGWYTHQKNVGNSDGQLESYVLNTQRHGWKLLERLCNDVE